MDAAEVGGCSGTISPAYNSDIAKSTDLCPSDANPDATIRAMKRWLQKAGLVDLEPVSLNAEQLEKETCAQVEKLADHFRESKTAEDVKRAMVQGIPRQAVLKPSHAIYRLQGQTFGLGDRVIMVQDAAAGGVPLGMKGVVVGLSMKDIDVVWDVPFIGGETLGGRCVDATLAEVCEDTDLVGAQNIAAPSCPSPPVST